MLLLNNTSSKIDLITSASADIDAQASWADHTTGALTPGGDNTAIASATTTDIVPAPSASTQRQIKYLSFRNKHATTDNTITVRHNDGTTTAEIIKVTLAAGETLQYVDSDGFTVLDSTGAVKTSAGGGGRYLATQILTSSTSFTTGPNTRRIKYRIKGCGGGGAGSANSATSTSAGAGGGEGAWAEGWFNVSPNTTYNYVLGTLGQGGTAGANDGTAGTDTTLTVNGTTITVPGGLGGQAQSAGTGSALTLGGQGGGLPTNGDLNIPGANGHPGFRFSGTIGMSGSGASGPLGQGGPGLTAAGAGNDATGFGAGGGGALTENGSGSNAGGDGAPAIIMIDEHS